MISYTGIQCPRYIPFPLTSPPTLTASPSSHLILLLFSWLFFSAVLSLISVACTSVGLSIYWSLDTWLGYQRKWPLFLKQAVVIANCSSGRDGASWVPPLFVMEPKDNEYNEYIHLKYKLPGHVDTKEQNASHCVFNGAWALSADPLPWSSQQHSIRCLTSSWILFPSEQLVGARSRTIPCPWPLSCCPVPIANQHPARDLGQQGRVNGGLGKGTEPHPFSSHLFTHWFILRQGLIM